jgi:hypothetical protein
VDGASVRRVNGVSVRRFYWRAHPADNESDRDIFMNTTTLDNNTVASAPGGVRLSEKKMRRFHPELFPQGVLQQAWFQLSKKKWFWRKRLEEHLMFGDSRAALVVMLEPVVVAAYTEDIDCVALLQFPSHVLTELPLRVRDRLLTVNLYGLNTAPQKDLDPGPGAGPHWNSFSPMIADFFSDDFDRINARKREIPEAEWRRTWELAQAYLARHGSCFRNGAPMECTTPAPVQETRAW